MPSQTAVRTLSDLLRWESKEDGGHTREAAVIKNSTAAIVTLADPLGTPLKLVAGVWEIALNADVATVDGLLLHTEPIAAIAIGATTTRKYLILARGPAIISKAGLPVNDPAGTPWTTATLIATLLALGIKVENNPPQSGTSGL